jgi:DNA ligase-1
VTSDNVIIRKYGVIGGALTTSVKQITSGKNIGKKNETTPFEQACLEAKALFKKQLDSGYSTEQGLSKSEVPKPMLAHGYDKQAHKITFPAMVQPKLDGVRMLLGPDGTCLSRTGKKFSAEVLGHIVEEHEAHHDHWLDGELYSDDLTFEEIVSACRKQSGAPNVKIQYHVYDIVDPNKPFCERLSDLKRFKGRRFTRVVKTLTVHDAEEVLEHHDTFVQEGYEGIMIRNKNSHYEQKRSYHLQKMKNFQDDEFFISDIKEATGNDAGTAIVQCKNSHGDIFWVRPRGTREYRAEILKQKDLFQGQLLTVRFQNLTDKGVPRFPVGIAVRNYE